MKTLALINGNIYLERERFAEALYAEDGIIAAVGTSEEILALAGEDCEIIDAGGKTVIPGINDAHCHFLLMGIGLTRAETAGSTSIDDLVARCRAFREAHPEMCEHGILSLGFNEDLFTEGEKRLPNRYDLDRIATDIPVVLVRGDGHIAVCNSYVIEELGVAPGPLPEGGEAVFDEMGEATGVFREAAYYPQQLIPDYSAEDYERAFQMANDYAVSCGVTSVQSTDICTLVGEDLGLIRKAIDNVYEKDLPDIRYRHQICYYSPEDFERDCASGAFFGIGKSENPKLAHGPLKLFADGSLGGRTATLIHGYADDPGNFGIATTGAEDLLAYAKLADRYGVQVIVHCIGDQAILDTVTAYESVLHRNEEEIDPLRHIVLHCQITDGAMLKRIAADDLLVGVQPITLNYDMHMVDDRCGPELTATSYAYNTLEELGVHVAYGTDAPIDNLNPFPCLYTAVTRKDLSGWPEGGWHPGECVDIWRAVDAYTAGAAYQEFEEERKGRIKPGFLCDLAVLDTDIFTADPFALRDTRCDMTIIGGEVVYRRNEE